MKGLIDLDVLNKSYLVNNFKQKLHYRIFFFGSLFFIILIAIIAIAFYTISSREIRNEMLDVNLASMDTATNYFEEQMARYDEILYSMLFDEQFISSLTDRGNERLNFAAQNYIESKMINIHNLNTEVIQGVEVYTYWNQRHVFLATDRYINYDYIPNQDVIHQAIQFHDSGFMLTREVNDFHTRERIALVSIVLDWSIMDTAFDLLATNTDYVFITDRQGDLVYSNTDQTASLLANHTDLMVNATQGTHHYNVDRFHLFTSVIDDYMQVNKVVEETSVFRFSQSLLEVSMVIGFSSIGLYLIFITYFYCSVIKPIKALANNMREIEQGDWSLDHQPYQFRKDEIGVLNNNFIKMINQIKYLIETQYRSELAKKDAQFKMLQNKINPHFLHNTLQTIGNSALQEDGATVYRLIEALGAMFKYTLRTEGCSVTLAEEVRHIEYYLFIQQERFKDRLAIDLYIDEAIKDAQVPILMLQPLIENVFQHGFAYKQDNWHVFISAEKVFDDVEIRIIDNGMGVTEQRFAELQAELEKNDEQDVNHYYHIGLKNVNARIKYMYGHDYGLFIKSDFKKGFEIEIRLPIVREAR